MITFAGVGLTPPSDAQALVSGWWHQHRICEFDHPFYSGCGGINHLPLPAVPLREAPRIGVLHWPTGASRWATCHLLATGEQLAAVRSAIGSTPVAKTLVMDDNVNDPVETDLWLLPPRPIAQRGERELYLLSLVDDRYWWWQHGDEDAPIPSAWSDFFTSMLTSVGALSRTVDAVDGDYSTPGSNIWSVGYKPLPPLLDAAALTVGRRIIRSLAGHVTVQSYTNAAAQDETNWTTYQYEVMAGGRLLVADIARALPASVTTVFRGFDTVANANATVVVTVTLASLALTEFSGLSAASGMVAQIAGNMTAEASSANRTAYATQAATDYYLWALSRTDCTIQGLVARPPTGLDWATEWVHGERPEDFATRVIRAPFADRNHYGDVEPFRITGTTAGGDRTTVDTSWQDHATLSAPRKGDYEVHATASGACQNATAGAQIVMRLTNSGTGTVSPHSFSLVVVHQPVAGQIAYGSHSITYRVNLDAGDTVKLQVKAEGAGVWTTRRLSNPDNEGYGAGIVLVRVGPGNSTIT